MFIYKKYVMKRIILYLAVVAGSLVFISWVNTDERFIINLVRTLILYNQNYPSERVYVHLDKQFYQPGESIWFRAYISSTMYDDYSSASRDLFIKVFDVFGNELIWERYPVENNTAAGVIPIPKSVEDGKYIMTAFTGWMKNMEAKDVYPVEIIISKNVNRQFLIDFKFADNFLKLNEENMAELSVYTVDHRPATGAAYSYSVNIPDEVIEKGKGKTDEEGKAAIGFNFPAYARDKLSTLNIEVKYSGENESIVKRIPPATNNVDLKFFPEGGNIIAGIENKIAFGATDNYGFPLDIEGNLYDGNDNLVTQIKSNSIGMGIFKLNPGSGQYKIKITNPEGIDKEFPLPEISENGLALTYEGISNNSIIITATSGKSEEIEETYWVGRMNNKIYWGTIIRLKGSRTVEIPLINFPPGIVQINVFNKDKMNIARRFIYIGGSDKAGIKAMTDKTKYGPREKVTVSLYAGDSVSDTFKTNISLSVVNKNLVGNSYNYQSLLNPHYINCRLSEESADFISRIDYHAFRDNIDLIMMTIGTEGPSYSDILKTDMFRNPPYHKQDGLSGAVIDRNGNPVRKAAVKFVYIPDMNIYETTSNENGLFNILFGSNIINFNFLTLTVSDEIIRQVSQILIDNIFSDKIVSYFAATDETWDTQKTTDLIAYGNPGILYTGKYQKIRKDKISVEQKKSYDKINYSSFNSVLDIINQIKAYTLINNQIVFQGGINSVYSQQGALIVLDGMQVGTDVGVLESVPTSDIENINISTNVVDIQTYTGLNSQGVIEITTKTGKYSQQPGKAEDEDSSGELKNYEEFYSPDYELETGINDDTRTTIYWNNNITVSPAKETTVSFYTSDIKGEYTGRIEGTGSDGIPVHADFQFKVE